MLSLAKLWSSDLNQKLWSFRNKLDKIGRKIDPCGTHVNIISKVLRMFLILKLCLLSFKLEKNESQMLSHICEFWQLRKREGYSLEG